MAPPTKARKSTLPTTKHAHRRQLPVDTNVHSYDRTDPFQAINVLRRLIGSLASRVGGCQYKFSPDEHKVSLHLLTILEPFVGLSLSRRTLTHQPTEILDAIIYHLDSKRDLLSLALSCHRMHAVIFPRHYDYRVICAKASSLSLWNHLIVNRALARNVRVVEIVDERSSKPLILPTDIMTTDTDLESSDDELTLHSKPERLLACAVAKMTALRSFHWSCNHSTISVDNVWSTLRMECPTLSQVNISGNVVFLPYTPDRAKTAYPRSVPVFPELKTVALQATKHVFGSTKTPALTRISGMLMSCPNLEIRPSAGTRATSSCRRRFLSMLSMARSSFALPDQSPLLLRSQPRSASAFFAAHANLEVIHLDLPLDRFNTTPGTANGTNLTLSLPPDALPKLRELKCGKAIATAILNCPTESPRPLEVLKGISLSGSDGDSSFFSSLKQVRGFKQPLLPTSQGLRIATNVAEWAMVLAPLKELTTFVGVKFFYEVSTLTLASSSSTSLSPSELSRVRKNDKVAGVLGNKCPKLRRLDHWEDAGGKVIVLSKDGNEVRWEVKRVKA
ncbi:hypothetical protein JVU11DRAFT_11331 [Chiua virens]|nr:hypothetical protein JVU11DRAFT_11331 [Chiua virens]